MKKKQNGIQDKKDNKKLLLLIIGLLLIAAGILYYAYDNLYSPRFGVVREDILIRVPIDELPENTLYITEERRYYQRGKMTLIIPSIDVFTPVGESTLPEGLKEMPGLYEFSQLPGEGDVNVSIAGHRDIYGMEFYSLDEVKEGDSLYLLYDGNVYRYLYRDTRIVTPKDWDVIKPQGFSCLTLTTCDPIGTTINRMIVRSELVDTQIYNEEYKFISNEDTQPVQP